MSIQSQIDRIVGFRNASLEAVANKGVNVPSDATIDDLPDLIDEIQTGSTPVLQTKTVSPSTSQQTVAPDSGYDGLSQVTVNAMPSGFAGTPKATKGTVSNHSISVTPSVTNMAGYITGGTKGGTAVTVSASELAYGTKSITSSGTIDVTDYASASVAAGSATTPSTYITADPVITVSASGLVEATADVTESVTPTVVAGYVSSGTAGNVRAYGYDTYQLPVYNGAHHQPTPSGYTVTVSLTNPVNEWGFSGCDIKLALSDDVYDWGEQIGSISSATGSTEVSVDSSLYGIVVYITGASVGTDLSMCSCTGGASAENTDHVGTILFRITGNGTITIDGVDYDD